MSMDNFKSKKSVSVVLAAMLMSGVAPSAYAATLDNTANASGTYDGGTVDVADDVPVNTDTGSTANVTLAAPSRGLSVSVAPGTSTVTAATGSLGSNLFPDGDDTITVVYTVTNTGNVTEEGVTLTPILPVFLASTGAASGTDGVGSYGAATVSTAGHTNINTVTVTELAPAEVVQFTAVYTLDQADAFLSVDVDDGVEFTATATGANTGTIATPHTSAVSDAGTTEIQAITKLTIAKSAHNGGTDLLSGSPLPTVNKDDVITYTYQVSNLGNVPLTNVSITDAHGDVSDGTDLALDFNDIQGETATGDTPLYGINDMGANDGKITTLAAGGSAIFTYAHTVTQPEIDAQ